VKRFSTEKFLLYRMDPYRVLYHGGLGFIVPPTKADLSAMPKSRREKYHPWLFIDKATAEQLAASMNCTTPASRVYVKSLGREKFALPKTVSREIAPPRLTALEKLA
jgi:hypothetical protein